MAAREAAVARFAYHYPRPAVTVDAVVIRLPVSTATASTSDEGGPTLLLIERGGSPFKGCWALPGGFVDAGEDLATAAVRELEEETGAKRTAMAQIGSYGAPGRDPRGHTITVAYAATLTDEVHVKGGDDAAKAAWVAIGSLPRLAFDHSLVVSDALRAVARALKPGSEPFLSPDQITLIPKEFVTDESTRTAWAESLDEAGKRLAETQPWPPKPSAA